MFLRKEFAQISLILIKVQICLTFPRLFLNKPSKWLTKLSKTRIYQNLIKRMKTIQITQQWPSQTDKTNKEQKHLNSKQYDQQNCEFQVEVINYKTIEKQFTIYQIKVIYGSLYWIFQTRYSLLEDLNSKLNKQTVQRLEKFPEKRLFGNLDQQFILKRKTQIDFYLKSLFKQGRNEKAVKEFIKQSQKAAIEINDPCELKHFKLDA